MAKERHARERVSVAGTLALALRVFARRILPIWVLSLPSGLAALLTFVLRGVMGLAAEPLFFFAFCVVIVASYCMPFGLQCSVAIYVHGSLKNEPPPFRSAFVIGLERASSVIVHVVLMTVLALSLWAMTPGVFFSTPLTIAFSCFCLGGFLALTRICAWLAACGVERLNGNRSIRRAWELSKGNFPLVFSSSLISELLFFSFLHCVRLIMLETNDNLIVFIILDILGCLVISFIATLLAVTYCQLKIADENHKIKEDSVMFDEIQYP
ncbi:MAG: hypothetical protein LBF58_03485 [Deltaproteobacteria bacterium]|jgi:hypothetical protein|nr:hypothetical protein [Deltaproteobacteria bacterium]